MKINLIASILFGMLAFSTQAQTGQYVPELAAFDNAMQQLMANYNVPGAQLSITYQGRLVYNRGFGLANVANNEPVTPDHLFRIASVSKPVTGIACMKLFEQGKLHLDAKVFGSEGILNDAKYLNYIDQRVENITVRMLLQHSGGWNRNISGDPMFETHNMKNVLGLTSLPTTEDAIVYVLNHKTLNFNPGTQSQYSNFGYCVLGRVIEKITGQSYDNYVREHILQPLGIQHMQLGYNLLEDQLPNEVTYYDYPGAPKATSIYNNSMVDWPYGGFNLEFMDAHGGWVASGQDLMKLVCAVDRFSNRPDILKTSTIDTMIKPSPHDPNYALGFSVNPVNYWHNGSLPGTTAMIARAGNQQLNWAILLSTRDQNLNINAAVDNLVWSVLPSITTWPSHNLFDTPAQITYVVTSSASPSESGSVSGGGSFADGSSVTLTAFPNTGYDFMHWEENGEPVSNTNPYTFTLDRNHHIEAVFAVTTDIAQHSNTLSIDIYPNPTSGVLHFSIPSDIQVTNIAGQVIAERKNAHSIDLSGHASGIYFVTILDDDHQVIHRKKIIKR